MAAKPLIPVIVDTREQRPWPFAPELFAVKSAAAFAGDYILDVPHPVIAIERKSLGDFVGTVVHDWIRFRKELYRLAHYDAAVIAVECDLADIWEHRYESDAIPESIIGRANSCLVDHGVPVVFWGDSAHAARMAARLLTLAWKRYSGNGE
jgi:DNA excision repair protein ERCC-4